MLIKTSNPIDKQKAIQHFDKLINKDCMFELTEKMPKRSLSQNSYLHLIIDYFALETGYSEDYVKREFYKKLCNPSIFIKIVKGTLGEVQDLRSSKDLDTREMTESIERFRNWSAREAQIYLPEPSDLDFLQQIEYEISKNKNYL